MSSRTSSIYASYPFFNAVVNRHTGKTYILALERVRSCHILAYVKWYGPCRNYCFFPSAGTVWSDNCLEDVRDLFAKLQAERLKESA